MTNAIEVLVCDDAPILREMVRDYLGGRGYQVVETDSAASMRERISKQSPDVIVLDVNMPSEDGLTALRALRVETDVPVIMLTAADEVVDRVVGLEMGADDYLGKPVDLRELEARIKAALRRRPTVEVTTARSDRIQFGACQLDPEGARLIGADGARHLHYGDGIQPAQGLCGKSGSRAQPRSTA